MADGDVWISGDTIGVTRMNTKTNVVGTVPSSPIAGQVWLDTANNLLKIRNAANNAWLTVGPSTNYISSVDAGYFSVTAGQITFTGTHAQAVGATDSPTFAGLTIGDGTINKAVGTDFTFNSGLIPSFDNTKSLGTSSFRWNSLFIGAGISTPLIYRGVANDVLILLGGTTSAGSGADIQLWGNNVGGDSGRIYFYTPNAAGNGYVLRMTLNAMQAQGSAGIVMYEPLTVSGTITGYYMSGDYGVAWASISLPNGVNGMQLVAYNSNAGVLASRLYIYTASAWHYIAIV